MRPVMSLRLFIGVLLLSVVAFGQETKAPATNESTPTILFVCEHGAAKSVIAAAYFDKLAKERGLKHRAVFRGTSPDPALAPAAVKGLKDDGLDTKGWKPSLLTKQEMKDASAIVTLGCAVPEKDAVAEKVSEWNETPSVSQNYAGARDYILKKVQGLIDELAKQQEQPTKRQKSKP